MARAVVAALLLVCCAADAAQAFRHRGHYHYAVPVVPRDCTKIKAARKDITDENWSDVEKTLTYAQRRFIESCMAEP